MSMSDLKNKLNKMRKEKKKKKGEFKIKGANFVMRMELDMKEKVRIKSSRLGKTMSEYIITLIEEDMRRL